MHSIKFIKLLQYTFLNGEIVTLVNQAWNFSMGSLTGMNFYFVFCMTLFVIYLLFLDEIGDIFYFSRKQCSCISILLVNICWGLLFVYKIRLCLSKDYTKIVCFFFWFKLTNSGCHFWRKTLCLFNTRISDVFVKLCRYMFINVFMLKALVFQELRYKAT